MFCMESEVSLTITLLRCCVKSVPDPETQAPTDMLDAIAIEWFRSHGVEVSTVSDVRQRDDPVISQLIMDGVRRANQRAVSRAQTVHKFLLLPRDFSIEGGEFGMFGDAESFSVVLRCILLSVIICRLVWVFFDRHLFSAKVCFCDVCEFERLTACFIETVSELLQKCALTFCC